MQTLPCDTRRSQCYLTPQPAAAEAAGHAAIKHIKGRWDTVAYTPPSPWMSQTFICDPNIMLAAKFHTAIAKIQALARSKRAKRTTATLRSERVRGRQAYKSSYLTSHTQDNTQGLQGWAGLGWSYSTTSYPF